MRNFGLIVLAFVCLLARSRPKILQVIVSMQTRGIAANYGKAQPQFVKTRFIFLQPKPQKKE
jgi:hypothetical protein